MLGFSLSVYQGDVRVARNDDGITCVDFACEPLCSWGPTNFDSELFFIPAMADIADHIVIFNQSGYPLLYRAPFGLIRPYLEKLDDHFVLSHYKESLMSVLNNSLGLDDMVTLEAWDQS